jgi:hypothetical protein
MKHRIETPASRAFRWLEWESDNDTLTFAFVDGTYVSYSNGMRLFAEAKTEQHFGRSIGRWYNRNIRGMVKA